MAARARTIPAISRGAGFSRLGEHAAGETEVSTKESTMVARVHGKAVLQRGILAVESSADEPQFLTRRKNWVLGRMALVKGLAAEGILVKTPSMFVAA